jgi:alkylation response protein AidB-like acyl-CoA dehydrogenase
VSELEGEQAALRREARRFAEAEIAPFAASWDQADDVYPRHLFAALGKLGWLGIGFDERVGGSGGGPVERCILLEELTRASAGAALGIYVHTALAAAALAEVASAELAAELLPPLLRGEKVGAWAYAEPDAGADVTQVRLAARREGDDFVLNGTKTYITNAPFADLLLVVARTGGAPGRLAGLSVFAVDGESPGLARTKLRKLGMRPSELGELHFVECRVPGARRVGDLDAGFRHCLAVLSRGRIYAGAMSLGLAGAALEAAIAHVVARQQFGGPLSQQQAVRFAIAEMTLRVRAARELVYAAAERMAAGQPYDTEASIAKVVASEAATFASERALHLHGAQGFVEGSAVQRFYRDCKILEWGEGTNEVQREMIFRAVAGGYRP